MTEVELQELTKKELIEKAAGYGIAIKKSATKAKIIEAILASPTIQTMKANVAEPEPEPVDPAIAINEIITNADADAIPNSQRFMWVVRNLAKQLAGAGIEVPPKKADGSFDIKIGAPISRTFTVAPKNKG